MQTSLSTNSGERLLRKLASLVWRLIAITACIVVIAPLVNWLVPRLLATGLVAPEEAHHLPLYLWFLCICTVLLAWIFALLAIRGIRLLVRGAGSPQDMAWLQFLGEFVRLAGSICMVIGAIATRFPRSIARAWTGAPVNWLQWMVVAWPITWAVCELIGVYARRKGQTG